MRKDLIALVADKDIEFVLRGLFSRPKALGIRPIDADIQTHTQRDSGCAVRGVSFLSSWSQQYEYGLLMFDHEGSGKEDMPREELQNAINEEFTRSSWGDRARVIVLEPELEAWVWSDSPHVDEIAGWKGRRPPLRSWLAERGLLREGQVKPDQPKEAFLASLREVRQQRSASLYQQLAKDVSLRRCRDAAFGEFKDIMRGWFPVD